MRAEAASDPKAAHVRRLAQDKLPVRREGLQPVDSPDQLRTAQAWHALDAPGEQAGETGIIESQHGRIGAVGNSIHGKWQRIALVPAKHHALPFLAEVHQLVGIAQVWHAGTVCQFRQWTGHNVLVLHWNQRNGHAGHAANTWGPDARCGNYNFTANAPLGSVDGLHASIADLYARHAGMGIEERAALLC